MENPSRASASPPGPPSSGARVRRHPERAAYDRTTVDAILDEALICHVGFVDGARPYVIPTIHARDGDALYLHGSTGSRMMRLLAAEVQACVTATILDGVVLARSAAKHSMNYRSVVVLGRAEAVTESDEKLAALRALVEHVAAGRWDQARRPDARELRETLVARVSLAEASAKIRTGPPKDDEADLRLEVWAGVVPLALERGTAIEDAGA